VYIYGSYRKNKIRVPFLLDHPVHTTVAQHISRIRNARWSWI